MTATIVCSLLAPSFAAAANFTGSAAEPVTRAAFIHNAIDALGLPMVTGSTLSNDTIAADLLPYIETAAAHHALGLFGKSLDLQRGITRGQALQVLLQLTNASPKTATKTFLDVKKHSVQETAVELSLEQQWLQPFSAKVFGLSRLLRTSEANTLLTHLHATAAKEQQTFTIPVLNVHGDTALPRQDVLQGVWNILNDEFLYKDRLNTSQAADQAIQGLVNSLHDPYTVYMPPAAAQSFQNQLKGELEGIGAQVDQTGGVLYIVAPLPGSPAEKAGLQAKDQILKVDGTALAGLTLDDAVGKIRGPKGSTVQLHIRRGDAEMDVAVVRDLIKIADITVTYQNNIAIVKLSQFGDMVESDIRATMTEVAKKSPQGIILDLRNNPGGLLDAAGKVVSNFMPKGSVYVKIAKRQDTETDVTTEEPTIAASVPLVLLVNKGSASASEVVTGALQDAKRAIVVGEQTFGKGTVQQVEQFSDGSSLKVTIAEWHTPLGRSINGVGMAPDRIVVAPPGMVPGGTDDVQLQGAMQLLP